MRITLTSQTQTARNHISDVYSRLVKAQEQVATGKRVSRPSEDPVAIDKSLAFSQSIADIEQYLRNSTVARDLMTETQQVADDTYDLLQEAKNILLQSNSAAVTSEARAGLAANIRTLRDRTLDLANTKHLGKYILSGQASNRPPLTRAHTFSGTSAFQPQATSGMLSINGTNVQVLAGDTAEALAERINAAVSSAGISAEAEGGRVSLSVRNPDTGNVLDVSASGGYALADIFGADASESVSDTYTYAGDQGEIKIQASASGLVTANVTADRLFNLDGAAASGEPDVFALLERSAEAVASGTTAEIDACQQLIDNSSSRTLVHRVDLGARISRIDSSTKLLETSRDNLKELRSKVTDVDLTQAVVELQTQQQVYQASLYSASSMFGVSLLDFLK